MFETFLKVAVVQAAPVLFNVEATLDKMADLVAEATAAGTRLVLFPETFISVYPRGLSFGTVVGSRSAVGRQTWHRYWESSIPLHGAATNRLAQLARQHRCYLVTGITERSRLGGTLYCTLVYFGPDGQLLGFHRKVKPTAAERIIWGEGNGDDLAVYDTDAGRLGGLICWENYMPKARMRLYEQGVEVYLAPTADARPTWTATLQHIAMEGRCYVLGCNQYVTQADYPDDLPGRSDLTDLPEVLCRGGSAIVHPLGHLLAGPLYDETGILYADLNRRELVESKLDFDVMGHYGVEGKNL